MPQIEGLIYSALVTAGVSVIALLHSVTMRFALQELSIFLLCFDYAIE